MEGRRLASISGIRPPFDNILFNIVRIVLVISELGTGTTCDVDVLSSNFAMIRVETLAPRVVAFCVCRVRRSRGWRLAQPCGGTKAGAGLEWQAGVSRAHAPRKATASMIR